MTNSMRFGLTATQAVSESLRYDRLPPTVIGPDADATSFTGLVGQACPLAPLLQAKATE